MAGIFAKIASGEIPSFKIAEDNNYFAFLDIHPLVKGHTLVIPKLEVDKLFDLDDATYIGLFKFCKKIARSIEHSFECDRVGMAVIGLEVPHVHIHLIPINSMSDMDFRRPKLQLTPEEMKEIAETIRGQIEL